jgi:hypothetical protein
MVVDDDDDDHRFLSVHALAFASRHKEQCNAIQRAWLHKHPTEDQLLSPVLRRLLLRTRTTLLRAALALRLVLLVLRLLLAVVHAVAVLRRGAGVHVLAVVGRIRCRLVHLRVLKQIMDKYNHATKQCHLYAV